MKQKLEWEVVYFSFDLRVLFFQNSKQRWWFKYVTRYCDTIGYANNPINTPHMKTFKMRPP